METLIPISSIQVPDDDYRVTVRFNEANIEEMGIIYLHGHHSQVRIDLVNAGYVQVVDLSQDDGLIGLDSNYPEVIYRVENSQLIMDLAHQSQGIMADPSPEAYEECSHHRIILKQFYIDIVRYDYENLEPIFLVEEGEHNG